MANKVIIFYPDPDNDPNNYEWIKRDNQTPAILTTTLSEAKVYDDAVVDLPGIVSGLNTDNPGLSLYSGNPTTPPPKPF